MYNHVVQKVTNVHQVKVNEYDESEWNTRSHSVSCFLHRVNAFVINFNFIYYSSNKLFWSTKYSFLFTQGRMWWYVEQGSLYRTGGCL